MNRRVQLVLVFALLVVAAALTAWILGGSKAQPVAATKPASASTSPKRAINQPALPAPKFAPSPSTPAAEEKPEPHPLLGRLLEEGGADLTPEQVKSYLARNQRNAESLITASRLTKDLALLREAIERFPNDPRAQFELAMRSTDPQERAHALEALRQADPDNALGSCLSAYDAFKAGRSDDAVRLLSDAMQRGSIDDYAMPNIVAAEEAYLSAGFTPVQAKAAAMYSALMPQVSELNKLSREMETLRKAYVDAGDAGSAQSIAEMGIDLGQRMSQTMGQRILLSELVGIAVEQRFLKNLDPSTMLAASGITVEQRINQLGQRQTVIKETVHNVDPMSPAVDAQTLLQFLQRQQTLGEFAALQWLRGRLGVSPVK